ncbi:MAG: late competence development ComFB family protein [Coprococcus sp.]|nr:late competence development ComFB family protein [Coprococcus sp.]
MARKSNKTAHVLNLIAGHDASKDNVGEASSSEETVALPPSSASLEDAPPTPATPPSTVSQPAASQNVSVIDTTEEDPVADLIQKNLTNSFEQQFGDAQTDSPSVPPQSAEVISEMKEDLARKLEPEPEPAPVPEPVTVPEPEPEPVPEPITSSEPEPEPAPLPDPIVIPEPAPEPVPKPQETSPEPVPEPEPEPDFVSINVMEHIVKDKIIYYMRQFDVCTCDRCVADTIALTMNGLIPKYIVTSPAAVDPLLSYYTNRLISDVTVEATKACMIVKDHPRH